MAHNTLSGVLAAAVAPGVGRVTLAVLSLAALSLAGLSLAISVSACAGTPSQVSPVRSGAPASADLGSGAAPELPARTKQSSSTQGLLRDVQWRGVTLSAQGLALRLPDARTWRPVQATSWWKAEHASTNSSLEIKRWRQTELVDASDCEQQARLWRPELERATLTEVVSDERRDLAGFDSRVVVLTRWGGQTGQMPSGTHEPAPSKGARPVLGAVLAFGASLRSCLAVRFRTTAEQGQVVAERLALVSEKLLKEIRPLGITERVERRRR